MEKQQRTADIDATEALWQRIGRLEPEQVKAWRALGPIGRLELAFQMYQFALDIVRLTEKQRHPELSSQELAWQVARRIQGDPNLGK